MPFRDQAQARIAPAPRPADIDGQTDQVGEQRLAHCDRHVRTVLACGLCVPLLDQPALPEAPKRSRPG
ncbi:hypothetical protein BOQ63_005480 (plasmid) [Streptomyces viridifaciens]|nr:hypothetical protein BOQ63_005480 [Streptomyces viridifaciens]